MKILVTIPCLMTGGTEIQTLNLVRALIEGGHEVTTACYFEHTDYMVSQYESAGSRVVLFSPEGVRVCGVGCIRFLWKHLKRLRRSLKPDVVHVQYMAPGAIPIILLWLMRQRNIIATTHTNADIYSSPQLRLVRFVQRHVTRVFSCITMTAERAFFGSSNSLSMLERPSEKGKAVLPAYAHLTIYNSLPEHIQITDKVRESKEVVTIGVVSRLEPVKGMDLVIPAVEKVLQRHAEIRLLIVGDGSLCPVMQQSLSSRLSSLTSFVGLQGKDTLQSYYDQIDILLMPSRSEGFGLTAIEGMARGCVVVAAKTGGLQEVVKDGEVGLLHQPESTDDLANKVCVLLEDKKLLEKMRRNLSGYVGQFSFEKYSESFNKLYSLL